MVTRARWRGRERARGYSLVELMLTLAVAGLLLVSAGQLTHGWIASARVHEALAVMSQGVSRAKAIALRNPGGVSGAAAAAILCVSGNTVRLFAATRSPQAAAHCQGSGGLWTAQLHGSAQVVVNGAALSCLAFSNRALPLNPASTGGSDACPVASSALITAADLNATLAIN